MEAISDEIPIISDNDPMSGSGDSPLVRIVMAPFTRRTWSEVGYAFASIPLLVAALIFIVPTLANGLLWGASASGVRRFGSGARTLSRRMLGQEVALPLVEGGKREVALGVGDGLHERHLHGRISGECQKLVHLAQLAGELGRRQEKADTPPGDPVGLAER